MFTDTGMSVSVTSGGRVPSAKELEYGRSCELMLAVQLAM
jgi:hypothetical protein